MRILVPLILVGLAACYSPRTTGPDGYASGMYGGWDGEPMQASLFVDPHTLLASFDLNRPAHVAVFHWQPGQSFTLVHPVIGQAHQRSFEAGRHYLWTRSRDIFPRQTARRAQFASTRAGLAGPSYFVLIASERPLSITPFMGTGQSMWVNRVTWGINPYSATELLASQIVPQASSTEWTAAYQVVWPMQDELRPRATPFRWVDCDGIYIAVPLHVLAQGLFHCPNGERVDPLPEDSLDEDERAQMVERIAELRERRGALGAERPSADEMASLAERIRQARREAGDEVDATPIPRLKGIQQVRTRATATATGTAFRPVIRPVVPDRAERATRMQPGMRTDPRSRQGVDRPRPHADSPRSRAERPRPDVQRPRPATERPRPQAERPAPPPRPQAERPPARPADRPPPEGSRD
jgi:hypothetical protein